MAGGLVLATLPVADGAPVSQASSASHATRATARHPKPKIGNSCLIGTWRDGRSRSSTVWQGHTVRMRYHGGDVDHIYADGIDHDSWAHSRPFYGRYKGHTLKQVIRGRNRLRFTVVAKHTVRTVEKGWRKGSTNRYVYRGHHVKGSLGKRGHYTQYFHCTAKRLTWTTKKGRVITRERRLSRKP